MTLTRRRTKTDYLDTALALANGPCPVPHAYVVAHVDMAQVAKAAGVSRTALYRLWDTQESFRADLAAYLAAHDDAPWAGRSPGGVPSVPPPTGGSLADPDVADAELLTDPRRLLRAGIAGHPHTADLTAVIAERERERVVRHATTLACALETAGRRCRLGITPSDLSLVLHGMADGLAVACRITPPEMLRHVGHDGGPGRSLQSMALSVLFEGLSQPIPGVAGRDPVPSGNAVGDLGHAGPHVVSAGHSGRRLDYLRFAAALARGEPAHDEPDEPADSYALGYVSLDALARAEGVTRAAVRKQWPTQADFRPDLFAHLLGRHRQAVLDRMSTAVRSARAAAPRGHSDEVLLELGDGLAGQVEAELEQVSHLSFAPQLVLPRFRAYVQRRVGPLMEQARAAPVQLLTAVGRRPRPEVTDEQLAVVVLAFLDGMTRVSRTHSPMRGRQVPHRDHSHDLVAVAFETLLLGLSHPIDSGPIDSCPLDAIDLRNSAPTHGQPTQRSTS